MPRVLDTLLNTCIVYSKPLNNSMKRDPLISHFTDEEVRHKEIRLQPQNQGPS